MENGSIENRKRILRLERVKSDTGLGRSTIYLKIKEGTLPEPVKLGPRAVGWLEDEIQAWIESRIELRDNVKEKNASGNKKAGTSVGDSSSKKKCRKIGLEPLFYSEKNF